MVKIISCQPEETGGESKGDFGKRTEWESIQKKRSAERRSGKKTGKGIRGGEGVWGKKGLVRGRCVGKGGGGRDNFISRNRLGVEKGKRPEAYWGEKEKETSDAQSRPAKSSDLDKRDAKRGELRGKTGKRKILGPPHP